jgi:uncharacterized protein YbjQ (UPF0145 family)
MPPWSGNPDLNQKEKNMILTTTPNVEGHRIIDYLGVVAGEAILGTNFFRDFFANIRDIVGGRSGAYEKELRRAREIAFQEIQEEALKVGANAIVGIDLDYEVMGDTGSMLMVSVSGTAVKVAE